MRSMWSKCAGLALWAGAWAMSGAPHPAHAQEVTIAVAGPMTGPLADLGDQIRRGAEVAVGDVNAAGGAAGNKVNLLIGDDSCEARKAAPLSRRFVELSVRFVVGHGCSAASIAAAPAYASRGIIMITPSSTADALTDDAAKKGWRDIFRTIGRDDAQGTFAGRAMAAKYAGAKVAVLDDGSAYGYGLAAAVKAALRAAGQAESYTESIPAGRDDHRETIAKLKAADVAAVFYGGGAIEAARFAAQSRDAAFAPQFIGGDALNADDFVKFAGAAADGFLMTFVPDPRHQPAAQALLGRFAGAEPGAAGYTLYAYAAVRVWADAATRAGALDGDKVEAVLRGGRFDTVVGPIAFDAKGDVVDPALTFYRFANGQWGEAPDALRP